LLNLIWIYFDFGYKEPGILLCSTCATSATLNPALT
jgi:hypothetical protein